MASCDMPRAEWKWKWKWIWDSIVNDPSWATSSSPLYLCMRPARASKEDDLYDLHIWDLVLQLWYNGTGATVETAVEVSAKVKEETVARKLLVAMSRTSRLGARGWNIPLQGVSTSGTRVERKYLRRSLRSRQAPPGEDKIFCMC
jgi:hypothetical protein